jgi:hypothetical protein
VRQAFCACGIAQGSRLGNQPGHALRSSPFSLIISLIFSLSYNLSYHPSHISGYLSAVPSCFHAQTTSLQFPVKSSHVLRPLKWEPVKVIESLEDLESTPTPANVTEANSGVTLDREASTHATVSGDRAVKCDMLLLHRVMPLLLLSCSFSLLRLVCSCCLV